MATYEKPKPPVNVPLDLLQVIRDSGVLGEKVLAEVRSKILTGEYPNESIALAEKLVKENLLTAYQTKRFLSNKSHGLLVGRYVILDRLGSGSMGRVYRAHHQMMDRTVALKIIAPEIVCNERVVARFQREMKLVGRLDHPNVIRAYDADQIGKVLYIVMEYVPGRSLGTILRTSTVAPASMAEYAAQAALGLAHAHEQAIVHRDIKPSNLLLTDDRKLKVLDLGLGVLMEADSATSFATADGIAVGTVDYMSPEQASGRELDGRSDLYSLGCSVYHMISGKLPFPGDNPIVRMGRRISGRHVPITDVRSDISPALVKVLDKLLANKPQDRFQSGAEAAEALRATIRPKVRSVSNATQPRPDKPALNKDPAPPAKPPEPVVVKVTPNYPRWFRPVAQLAENRPVAALSAVIAALAVTFGSGFLLARLIR